MGRGLSELQNRILVAIRDETRSAGWTDWTDWKPPHRFAPFLDPIVGRRSKARVVAVSRALSRLEARGLVERGPHKRTWFLSEHNRIRLTPAGRDALSGRAPVGPRL